MVTTFIVYGHEHYLWRPSCDNIILNKDRVCIGSHVILQDMNR